tara:strand:- start:39 stop:395 length:357 start_codon:yes stop_codon:yes gene_type:complete
MAEKKKPKVSKVKKKVAKATKKSTAPKTTSLKQEVPTRGRTFVGKVISAKMTKTVKVQWPRRSYLYKYERFEAKRSSVKAHNPETINAQVGDTVRIAECRPLSKTKKFIIIEKMELET